jgi:hypothetical protein
LGRGLKTNARHLEDIVAPVLAHGDRRALDHVLSRMVFGWQARPRWTAQRYSARTTCRVPAESRNQIPPCF